MCCPVHLHLPQSSICPGKDIAWLEMLKERSVNTLQPAMQACDVFPAVVKSVRSAQLVCQRLTGGPVLVVGKLSKFLLVNIQTQENLQSHLSQLIVFLTRTVIARLLGWACRTVSTDM